MKRRERDSDIFSVSFLDVISCGFGAIVLLLLITKSGTVESDVNIDLSALIQRTFQTEDELKQLSNQLAQLKLELEARKAKNQTALLAEAKQSERLKKKQTEAASLQSEASGLELVKQTLQRASIATDTAPQVRDDEVGGIPVDSNYVIFIIDTSGSMQQIWERVLREVGNILDIHPQVKGFQIMNDNGFYLLSAYKRKWIPDTPKRRKRVLDTMRGWQGISNSSPVEGLEVALKTYAKVDKKISIYIFGDDYSGASYDAVIRTLEKLNTNKITGQPIVRVHAIGFLANQTTGGGRFEVLMREVTQRNNGVFLALPIR